MNVDTPSCAGSSKLVSRPLPKLEETEMSARIVDSCPMAVFAKDDEGRYILANFPYAKLLGADSSDGILGKKDESFFDATGLEAARRDEEGVLREGTCVSCELVRGGRVIRATKFPLYDSSGRPYAVGGVVADESQTDKNAGWSSLFHSPLLGLGFCNEDGKIDGANPALAELLGYAPSDFTSGRVRWADVTPAEYQSVDVQAWKAVIEQGCSPLFEKEFICANGHRLPTLVGMVRFSDGAGFGVFFVVPLTERKRAEKRLKLQHAVAQLLTELDSVEKVSPALLSTICDFLGGEVAALWLLDRPGDHLRCREVWERLGAGLVEFRADSWSRHFAPGEGLPGWVWFTSKPVHIVDVSSDRRLAGGRVAARAGLKSAIAFPVQVRDQVLGVVECFSRQSIDHAGDVLEALSVIGGQFGLFLQRRQAEAEILRLNQDLERRVQERTAALQESHEQMESFCYTVSHDLRAPLRAMQGFAGALLDDFGPALGPVGQDYASRVVDAVETMDRLIMDLLEYFRLERQRFAAEPVDISFCVGDVIKQLSTRIAETGAEVIDRTCVRELLANPVLIHEVILNLLENALKFVPEGTKPRIEIWTEDRNQVTRLLVRDNGIGIDARYHDRIFRIFERLHGREVFPGTGIGLAIVRKAMERMGGAAGLESRLGEGACFWVELPRLEAG